MAAHPGYAATNPQFQSGSKLMDFAIGQVSNRFFAKTRRAVLSRAATRPLRTFPVTRSPVPRASAASAAPPAPAQRLRATPRRPAASGRSPSS
jgi:hypothetical protein